MGSYLFEDNHLRRHGGLNYETPFDKLPKATELVNYYNRPLFSKHWQKNFFNDILAPMKMKKRLILFSLITLALAITACGSSNSNGYGLRPIAAYSGATLYITTTPEGDGHIRVISLKGSFRDMGRQYGYLLKADLQDYYQKIIVDYLMGVKGLSYGGLLTEATTFYANSLAESRDFMQGVVETSGLTLPQIQLINYSTLAAIAACSAVAAWGQHTGGGPLVIGRNWDMNTGSLDRFKDYMMVTVYNPPTGNAVADINYMGQFQAFQSAMNDKGLWINIQNGSLSSNLNDQTKQDPNNAVFDFLRNASTMTELDALFLSGPLSDSFIMTVADSNLAYSYFWCTQGTYRFSESDQTGLLATSNHFVEYPSTWTINTLSPDPAAQLYTEVRRNNWLTLANSPAYNGKLNDDTMKSMLEHTIENGGGFLPATGYAVETIYQIVAVPQSRRLWIRLPKYYGWEKIEVGALFR